MIPKDRDHKKRQGHNTYHGEESGASGERRAPQKPALFGAERMKGLCVALIDKRR